MISNRRRVEFIYNNGTKKKGSVLILMILYIIKIDTYEYEIKLN